MSRNGHKGAEEGDKGTELRVTVLCVLLPPWASVYGLASEPHSLPDQRLAKGGHRTLGPALPALQ